jgi:uncharacterized delta-60 repeat protein
VAALVAALALVLACSVPVLAAAGPDPSFGVEGVVAPPLPAAAATSKAGTIDLAAAPGGGVYAALTGLGPSAYLGLARLDENGQPDPSFGSGGYAAPFEAPGIPAPAVGPSDSGPEGDAVAVQADGTIIVAGATVNRVYVAESGYTREFTTALLVRYLADGSLDQSFGESGSVEGDSGYWFRDVAVTADGRVLALSRVVRAFGPDGSPDPTFEEEARPVFAARRGFSDPRAIGLLPDGRILVAGYNGPRWLLLARLLPDGRADRSFGGGDGVAAAPITPAYKCCGKGALAVGPDGRVVVAVNGGYQRQRAFVARFDASGRRDRSFGGGDGLAVLPGGFEDYGLAVAADGSVYASGAVEGGRRHPGSFTYAVARLGPRGTLDRAFGAGGVETIRRGEDSIAASALTLPGGRVLVGGSYNARVPGDRTHQTTLLLSRYGP